MRYAFFVLTIAVLCSGVARAVVDPASEKDATPIVLKCAIAHSSAQTKGQSTLYSATCEVLEVIRSSSAIKIHDVVVIRYQVNQAVIDRERREGEALRMPGPAPVSAPRPLQDGETVIAYLEEIRNADGTRTYLPRIGLGSFEVVGRPASGCRDAGDAGPIMANEKVCAAEALNQAEQTLQALMAEMTSSIQEERTSSRAAGDASMDAALAGQAEALTASHSAWQQYRNDTCRYATFTLHPGSMARLAELECKRQLTGKRIEQLKRISSGAGESIDY